MQLAQNWRKHLLPTGQRRPLVKLETRHETQNHAVPIQALAEFIRLSLEANEQLLLVLPDDAWLPELSNAIDLELRPYCLVLPEAEFAVGITLRATLALLKSRLSRPPVNQPDTVGCGDDSLADACWQKQQQRITEHATLWQATLDWSRQNDPLAAWPAASVSLFPVLILPARQIDRLQLQQIHHDAPRDTLLLIHAERLSTSLEALASCAQRWLWLHDPHISLSRELAASDPSLQLQAELALLLQELGDMELEFATAQAELAEFTRRYHSLIGYKLVELDHLQAQLAQQRASLQPQNTEAQQAARHAFQQAEQSSRESAEFEAADRLQERPFAPSGDIKKLFRQLAQKIHPDRADNEEDRAWRTELMSEANRAYRNGDVMVLNEILQLWQRGPEGHPPNTSAPSGQKTTQPPAGGRGHIRRLQAEIRRIRQRIDAISQQLNRLLASRLYELFSAANLANRQDRDLLQEMAVELERQLAAARAELATKSPHQP